MGVSFVGFVLTLIAVYRSKEAAKRAQKAAESAREEIFRSSAMIELSAVATGMQEIKRLQRSGEWAGLLDRYSALRASLISIRASRPNLDKGHQTVIQSAITQIRTIEERVERTLSTGAQPSAVKLNAIISQELDQISEVLGMLRSNYNG
jgi:hypothetical protein